MISRGRAVISRGLAVILRRAGKWRVKVYVVVASRLVRMTECVVSVRSKSVTHRIMQECELRGDHPMRVLDF